MNTSKMNTIALDIGNVCIDIHPERCLSELGFPADTPVPQELWKSIKNMERGFIDEKDWLKTFRGVTDNKFSKNKLMEAYCSILGDERKEVVDFIRETVSLGVRVIFFSDTSPIHINQLFRDLSFANLITGGIYSFDAECCKPDITIFKKYETSYGAPLLYIDDKKENIKAGTDAGWTSILYESSDSLDEAYSVLQK